MNIIDTGFHRDIYITLFEKYDLNIEESNKYGFEHTLHNTQLTPFTDNPDGDNARCFWNVHDTYSYISYWKAGHSLINKILNKYQNVNGLGITKTIEPFSENIVLPYKDPLDRFLSAYFTSRAFKGDDDNYEPEYGSLFALTQQPTPGNIDELISLCTSKLDDFVMYALKRDDACGFGRELNHKQFEIDMEGPDARLLHDVHFIPIHIILWYALKDRTDRFKLFGCNLDHDAESFIFTDIRNNSFIDKADKDQLNNRGSANNRLIKLVCQQWKANNHDKCELLIQKYLSNDYKLIERLEKNTILTWNR